MTDAFHSPIDASTPHLTERDTVKTNDSIDSIEAVESVPSVEALPRLHRLCAWIPVWLLERTDWPIAAVSCCRSGSFSLPMQCAGDGDGFRRRVPA